VRCAEREHAGVVDQDVDIADLIGEAAHVRGHSEVRGDETRVAAVGGSGRDHLLAAHCVPARDNHRRSIAREGFSRRAADARGAGRHQGCLGGRYAA
jgi:hypothetical protein